MNDFTKEELENILTCVNAISYNNETSALTLKSAQAKIRSLIDNYICETHDSDCRINNEIISEVKGDISKPFKCKYCGEYYE